MIILRGKDIAQKIQTQIRHYSIDYFKSYKEYPKLAVVLVGNNPASLIYIKHKRKACSECNIDTELHHLPDDVSFQTLKLLINQLNDDSEVHGILVQFPLPDHVDANELIHLIAPEKDVDGFGPANLGGAWLGKPTLTSCTPKGIIKILDEYKIDIASKHAVIIGRSNIVGKPIAGLLLSRDATVTIVHSKTKNIEDLVKMGDIVIVAVGYPNLVKKSWLKKGAVVIDVGINRIEKENQCEILGDVDIEGLDGHVSAITPVPGGVGPMTIISLLQNVVTAAFSQQGKSIEFE